MNNEEKLVAQIAFIFSFLGNIKNNVIAVD